MDRNTLLKIQIIDILDSFQTPISLKELQEKIGYASIGTIRLNCKELQVIIDELYTAKSYSLELLMNNGRGIQLIRSSSNLQTLKIYLYQKDLGFEIIREILAKRSISTIQFCLDNNISESKLRRKIKQINYEIADYHVHISCSATISLKAREVDVRRFYYVFLRGFYRQFDQITWFNTDNYLQLALQTEEYLKLSNNLTNLEMISFWIFITYQAIDKKSPLLLSDKEADLMSRFKFPPKPAFLKNWEIDDWQYFLTAIYCSQLSNFELKAKDPAEEDFFYYASAHWVSLFSKHFRPLTAIEQKYVFEKIKQQYASFFFFKLNDAMLDQLCNSIALENMYAEFPYYFNRFQAFWEEFTQTVPEYKQRQLYVYSVLTSVTLFSLENYLPQVSVYVHTEFCELFNIYIQQKIDLHFRNHYQLTFTQHPKDAQLVIGTTPTCRLFLLDEQESIVIRSNISEKDYYDIDQKLQAIVQKSLLPLPEKVG
ncbi:helix-turn-helix domain-containing protein [Enterococcus hailinensis]|uniref:helix-turn-helix domain-containing protein n=1 Tax=Enterococcus hailinensis TaxID=3238988 RepID=UPI0038B3D833